MYECTNFGDDLLRRWHDRLHGLKLKDEGQEG